MPAIPTFWAFNSSHPKNTARSGNFRDENSSRQATVAATDSFCWLFDVSDEQVVY